MNHLTTFEIIKICNKHSVKNIKQLLPHIRGTNISLSLISTCFISYANRLNNPCIQIQREVKRLIILSDKN